MSYLESVGFVHSQLRAEHVLVGEQNNVKVGFGFWKQDWLDHLGEPYWDPSPELFYPDRWKAPETYNDQSILENKEFDHKASIFH